MKIIIDYDSSWRNSFLDGSNNESLPKKGRKFIGSLTSLNDRKHPENIKERRITIDTVMGVLNRIIGDQRKLYQSRNDETYFFKDIDTSTHPLIKFEDIKNKRTETNEMIYIRNITPNTYDKASFTGPINIDHSLLSSDYSTALWAILDLTLKELIEFIKGKEVIGLRLQSIEPQGLGNKLSGFKDIRIDKIEDIRNSNLNEAIDFFKHNTSINHQLKEQFPSLQKVFSDIEYIKSDKVVVRALYCSSLYLQAIRLSGNYDMGSVLLKGISVNGFTPKDFMNVFAGGKKKVYGNPYAKKEFKALKPLMTKASGQLEINLDISRGRGKKLKAMIENAGVSSFYLGKKGLAYVTSISTREVRR